MTLTKPIVSFKELRDCFAPLCSARNDRFLKYIILIFALFIGVAMNEIIAQTTSNDLASINYQNIHCVTDGPHSANGSAVNEAMFNNLLETIQDGYENNDIRLRNMKLVWQADHTTAPELVTNNNAVDDLNDFYDWYSINGDNRDFQVCFFSTMSYEAESPNGVTSEGWCRTVVGGGSDWIYTFSHEIPHTQGALTGGADS